MSTKAELAQSPFDEKTYTDGNYALESDPNDPAVPDQEILEAGDAPLGKVTGASSLPLPSAWSSVRIR